MQQHWGGPATSHTMGANVSHPYAREVERIVPGPPEAIFAALDDPLRLGRHMTRPSAMMLGGSMQYRLDASQGRAVGSVIRVEGRVLGLRLRIVEVVTERDPPRRKVWETVEEPQLLVFGAYQLGFHIAVERQGSRLRCFIDYDLPRPPMGRVLGRIGAHVYARWCLSRMVAEAEAAAREASFTNADQTRGTDR
ncbi:SRPBCC family protein [Rubellimicrobium aerolatum]|uniref:SRPBCC family protein n=1 Tax=Rubellimicrobium aerolatum TaxID=490979 RepID=A0ABW0SH59_9RHOB|nr:SRPBCC family protein [Rubellimicrobium aerolatum]MBP1807625.1 hypothetical protein [Rubellimicrobium aerolatum]